MNRNRTKIQYMVSTIFCISFSIVYAAGVYSALNDDQRNEMPNYKQDEIRCVKNTIFFKISKTTIFNWPDISPKNGIIKHVY